MINRLLKNNNRQVWQGFTLIELLISISVITIILSMSLSGVNASRMRSRDAKRIADLRIIQSALEQHAIGNDSRTYPPANSSDAKNSSYCLKYGNAGANYGLYGNKCFNDYLSVVPLDPVGSQYQYQKTACFVVSGTNVALVQGSGVNATCPSGSTNTTAKPYGLSVRLETGNFADPKNDETPTVATNLDIAP